ncbi:TPA: toxin PIN [Enterococcus faecium]|nr:toxin PIN [Enterococcus faecium]
MNNRHRRVAKLRKQELNVAKVKFEREYGVSAEEVVRLTRSFMKDFGQMVSDIGKAVTYLGKAVTYLGENLQRSMEEKE